MNTVSTGKEMEKQTRLARVSKITENLLDGRSLYQERLERNEMMEYMLNLFDDFSAEESETVDDEELIDRIDSILVLHATSGILNDLTPEQIEIFDAAVEGRW